MYGGQCPSVSPARSDTTVGRMPTLLSTRAWWAKCPPYVGALPIGRCLSAGQVHFDHNALLVAVADVADRVPVFGVERDLGEWPGAAALVPF